MNFFKKLFETKVYETKVFVDPNELIKLSTVKFKEDKKLEAIQLIKDALKIDNQLDWYDKLANYQYKSGLENDAYSTLNERLSKTPKLFVNQFSFDIPVLNRKKIWEKDKIKKEKYEALIHIKSIIDTCLLGDYDKYPSFDMEFNFDEINSEYKNYINEVKEIILQLNDEVKKINKHYQKNYLKYKINDENMSNYELVNLLIKDNPDINILVNKIKSFDLPFNN